MPVQYIAGVRRVHYPESDGKPMAESDFQRGPLAYAVESLDVHFEDCLDVYVSGNIFTYYEEGNPEAVVSPDVLVAFGVPKRKRRSFKLWQEPKGPDFVLEITSMSTRGEDQGPKRGTYAMLGVREYFQYDPTGDYLRPPLRGMRLEGENYVDVEPTTGADGFLSIYSETLKLELRIEPCSKELRFFDPATGQKLLSYRELVQARQQAEQARQQAEQARQQAEQARQQAEQARHAADARNAELESRLRALGQQP